MYHSRVHSKDQKGFSFWRDVQVSVRLKSTFSTPIRDDGFLPAFGTRRDSVRQFRGDVKTRTNRNEGGGEAMERRRKVSLVCPPCWSTTLISRLIISAAAVRPLNSHTHTHRSAQLDNIPLLIPHRPCSFARQS